MTDWVFLCDKCWGEGKKGKKREGEKEGEKSSGQGNYLVIK
jgi:hypothetical protein